MLVPSPSTVIAGSLPFYCYCWFFPLLLLLLVLCPSTVTAVSLPFYCYCWFSPLLLLLLVLSPSAATAGSLSLPRSLLFLSRSHSRFRTLSCFLSPPLSLPLSLSSSTSLPLSMSSALFCPLFHYLSLLRSHFRCPFPALSFPLSASLSLSLSLSLSYSPVFLFSLFMSSFLSFCYFSPGTFSLSVLTYAQSLTSRFTFYFCCFSRRTKNILYRSLDLKSPF